MKKIIIYIFAATSLFFISSCNVSKNVEAQKSETKNEVNTTRSTVNLSSEQNTNSANFDLKLPRVWVGYISSDNGNINSSNVVWSADDDTPTDIPESEGGIKIGTEYDVDIMNCGGYLGSGKIAFVEEGGFPANWRLKFSPETIAADGVEKVKQCDADTEDEYLTNDAFAIAPQNRNRQSTKISNVDTRGLFASLPKDTQKWLKNKYSSDVHKNGNLSLREDNWTDIDGDGRIDLIFAFTNYDEEHSSGTIMLLVNGEWKDIGDVRD